MKHQIFNNSYDALAAVGLPSDALQGLSPVVGVIHRVMTLSHPRSSNGWILMFSEGGFVCGNWENGETAVYSPREGKLNPIELRKARIRAEAEREQYQKERDRTHLQMAEKARQFYNQRTTPVLKEDLHPYLESKQIKPTETMRESTAELFKEFFGYYPGSSKGPIDSGRILVLPLVYEGKITNLQIISETGAKSFLAKARKKGCYWRTYKAGGLCAVNPCAVAIGEGVATVLSVVQHTDLEVLGIAAMDAGNLPEVAEIVRRQCPEAPLIILGDCDLNGVGQNAANKAADRVAKIYPQSVVVQIPKFSPIDIQRFRFIKKNEKDPTDWNDFYLIRDSLKETV